MKRSAAALCLLVAACGGDNQGLDQQPRTDAGAALDRLAIDKGLIPDPATKSLAGRYETRSELGTDKFCAVAAGEGRFRIGMLSVYGPESKCEAQGTAEVEDGQIEIALEGKEKCAFKAEYDGIVLRFPGTVPDGCASYCARNASMSGTRYYFVDPGDDAARRTLGREIERLCR